MHYYKCEDIDICIDYLLSVFMFNGGLKRCAIKNDFDVESIIGFIAYVDLEYDNELLNMIESMRFEDLEYEICYEYTFRIALEDKEKECKISIFLIDTNQEIVYSAFCNVCKMKFNILVDNIKKVKSRLGNTMNIANQLSAYTNAYDLIKGDS